MISNEFYYLLADKQTIRNIVENKKDGGISFNKDLIKFHLGEGDNKFILFSSLCGGLTLILIIYLIVSNRGIKNGLIVPMISLNTMDWMNQYILLIK